MIKFSAIFFIMFFSACSFKTPPNEWQYKSVNAYESYKKNFLSSNNSLADSDLKRAVGHAKKSSNLDQLARIYLGKCAINNSVGIEDSCTEFKELESLVDDQTMHSYYLLIVNKLTYDDIENLPDTYKSFAYSYINKDYKQAVKEMFDIQTITSKLIAANIVKSNMSVEDIEKLLEEVSFYGYKKTVVYWLKVMKTKVEDTLKIQKIDKKIKILES
ncbi:hypothetical protein [Sulfurimonas sp.]|uniref:hypothetical protein n=1 Tax=Sulfurimonas sp. TaxID=2022749 RepID=UPI0035643587